ncbi:MAG: SPFH domain-containing protein [Verrucomicrobiaceae bacterium]|nr:SPFH domain-containing protein [Verrucomicrobiaceae bacterium]
MKEREAFALPGIPILLLLLACGGVMAANFRDLKVAAIVPAALVLILVFKGFAVVAPNQATVLTLFGKYCGSLTRNGFWWINPLTSRQNVSLRITNFQSEQLKVNEAHGNPIEIAAVVVWNVVDSAKAAFEVEHCTDFVHLQCETALRHLANHFPYEPHNPGEISLRSHPEEVAEKLRSELQERCETAGVKIIEAQLSHLAYSPEIAQAMLRRQQAQAVIAARQTIVDGAISMVEMALKKLESDGIVQLDPAAKATMVNNLLVTLVSEQHVQPVMSTSPLRS